MNSPSTEILVVIADEREIENTTKTDLPMATSIESECFSRDLGFIIWAIGEAEDAGVNLTKSDLG
eukprot:snap_masked-scaffold_2-processed-gene-9.43-mRNA-1 protein AED:1.00 eAED:1.00 QI:0/0/0/0/1/1/2/0/64